MPNVHSRPSASCPSRGLLAFAYLLVCGVVMCPPAGAGSIPRISRRRYSRKPMQNISDGLSKHESPISTAPSDREHQGQQPGASYLRQDLISDCQSDINKTRLYDKHVVGGCGLPTEDGFPSTFPAEVLDKGIQELGGARTKRLLDKLRRGEAITVLAMGGSSMHRDGGCWNHRDCLKVNNRGLWTLVEEKSCGGSGACKGAAKRVRDEEDLAGGKAPWLAGKAGTMEPGMNSVWEPGRPKLFSAYLARFMQYVNTTFPNPGHVLKNHGKSGATGVEFLSCPNEFMLPEADLVIMDHAINFWEARVVESLLGYVMNTPKAPAVLLLNLHNWRGHGVPKERWPKSAEEVQTKYGVPEAHRIEDEAASLASKWGLSAVSVYNFMYPLMNGTFPLPSPFWPLPLDRLGTHCSYVRAVDMKPYSIYIGDLMIHWFRNVVSSPGRLTGITETLGLDNAPELKNVVVSCFTWGATGRRPIVVGNNNINTGAEIPERYAGRQGITNTWFRYLTPIDGPPAVRTRRKPGFYSVVPGAVADLRIGLYTSALPKVNNLKILYLASYELVGIAKFECIKGCSCKELVLDTRIPDPYTGQLGINHEISSFDISARACVVRVTNVGRQDGLEGNKVKITGLSLST